MKRIAWLFLGILWSATLLLAADKTMKKTGTICDAQCVTKVSGLNTCDSSCTAKSGTAVFVDDKGTLMQIENQDMCKSHMNQHVKLTAVPSEAQRENTLRIIQLTQQGP
ncbi:MAG TPA: hypothetical protein VKG65_04900 [Terriglobales bacterium]|nr:hypothetical protein [Terriglobales bacterium]